MGTVVIGARNHLDIVTSIPRAWEDLRVLTKMVTSTAQLMYVRLRERHGKGYRKLVRARRPGHLL